MPKVSSGLTETEERRARLGRELARLSPELLHELAQAVGTWWPIRPARRRGLGLIVVEREGGHQRLTLYHRVIRVGKDASCHVYLDGDRVAPQHCELRLGEDRLWLVDLGSSGGTKVNGYAVTPFEPWPTVEGDQIEIDPFRLVVGSLQVDFAESSPQLSLREPLVFPSTCPFKELGGYGGFWIRVAVEDWAGYLKIPRTWLCYAYQALGYEMPSPPSGYFGNEVDQALTSFLVDQIADDFSERSGKDIETSALLSGDALMAEHGSTGAWQGARFTLEVGGQCFEVPAVWPVREAGEASATVPEWLLEVPFPVAVVAGVMKLAAVDLKGVRRGDILLADRWFLERGAEDQAVGAGCVVLGFQSWTCQARLLAEAGETRVELTSGWRISPKGAFMVPEEPESASIATVEGEMEPTVRLPEEVEVLVSFELERIPVPLRELLSWQQGATLRLQRRAEDPVRIVLRQGGDERLLGRGRVMVVEDRLGIQIEQWLVEGQT